MLGSACFPLPPEELSSIAPVPPPSSLQAKVGPWVLLSPMEPQDMLVDVELSFGFKITLTTLKLGIPVSNSLVNSDLSFVERKITELKTEVLLNCYTLQL